MGNSEQNGVISQFEEVGVYIIPEFSFFRMINCSIVQELIPCQEIQDTWFSPQCSEALTISNTMRLVLDKQLIL